MHETPPQRSHVSSLPLVIVSRVADSGQKPTAVAREFRVTERTVRKWLKRFRSEGVPGLEERQPRSPTTSPAAIFNLAEELRDAVFAVLHTPPSDHGFNRTSWTLTDLANVLCAQGKRSTARNIGAVIHAEGYRWKQARVTLTSTDPDYRGKVEIIRSTLSRLEHDEAFFSIDEFGPFAVKMRAGRSLSGPHQVRVVPQWQKSKGSLIVTAALELSKNRISHFYSQKKNTIQTMSWWR